MAMIQTGPVVLVDMDGVSVDTVEGMQQAAETARVPGWRRLKPEELKLYYYERNFPEPVQPGIRDSYAKPGFYRGLAPLAGALAGLHELAGYYQVFLCSTPDPRNPTCASDKFAWVEEHLGAEWVKRLTLTFDKTGVDGDFLIDDKPVITGRRKSPAWRHLHFDNGCAYSRPACGTVSINWQNWREVIERQLALREACRV